jgi:superfamily II DNA or RNA helicase
VRSLRTHQRTILNIVRAVAAGETEIRDVLAAVTPGGGKSLLPVIAASVLIRSGLVDRVCWIVPRDSLRLQAEEAFVDPVWRDCLGHDVAVRSASNAPDPCRGLSGYVTTFQAIAAAPKLHLEEFRRHRYLVALDELHHLPAVADLDVLTEIEDETAWSRAIQPLLELARVRLLMSGTLERADGRPILWLPYGRARGRRRVRDIDLKAGNWAIVGYSRRQALAERAIIPVTFGAMDGEAEWLDRHQVEHGPVAISSPGHEVRPAIFTALRTEFAEAMLREAYGACREHRAKRRGALGVAAGEDARGLGKLLVVAPDQATAMHYLEAIRAWMPASTRLRATRIAISDAPGAQEAIAAFRLRAEPSVLVTVAMAYEGMDCPEVTHVACLTHIRSRPWLEQMVARATRVDPHAGAYEQQQAVVYHPDDVLFRRFRRAIETEQGTRARMPRARRQGDLFDGDVEAVGHVPAITPLRSNATALRFERVSPGPDFIVDVEAALRADRVETASSAEQRLRRRIGQMIAAQVVLDEDEHIITRHHGYHAYNAVVKRVFGKSRAAMTLAELEAVVGWLERNRISDHLHLVEDDPQYRWSSGQRRSDRPWTMPVGRRRV